MSHAPTAWTNSPGALNPAGGGVDGGLNRHDRTVSARPMKHIVQETIAVRATGQLTTLRRGAIALLATDHAPRSAANSAADDCRSAGSWLKALATDRRQFRINASAMALLRRITVRDRFDADTPANGRLPVISRQNSTARLYTSVRASTAPPAICSGAMYAGVPENSPAVLVASCAGQRPCQAEIGQQWFTRLVDQHVGGLDVPVDHSRAVNGLQARGQLAHDLDRVARGHDALLRAIFERSAINQRHRQVGDSIPCARRRTPDRRKDGGRGRPHVLRERNAPTVPAR